jgi:Zn-finger nucleic acid-binding protein
MQCPDCKSQLKVVKDKLIDKNKELEIIYCPDCGGFWLDSDTVNKLSVKNIDVYEKRAKPAFATNGFKSELRKCPQCQADLELVRAESIPSNVFVYTCKKCLKNWFSKGELKKFKQAQEAKIAYVKHWQVPLKSTFSILLPLFIIILIMISIPVTIFLVRVRQRSEVVAEEIISQPQVIKVDNNSVLISFETDKQVLSRIEYGLDKNKPLALEISLNPDNFHQVTLTSLLADRIYWYKLQVDLDDQSLTTPYYFFNTYIND